ncbi:MAG TPA: YtxH domain-containing protein [Candidatus Atribacteria bacterium]|nr:YtxH domain-containing protein [Candidatus Atribacteria bacterium]
MSFKHVKSFMIGGLMGVVAGMLLALRIEPDIRRRLLNQGEEVIEKTSERVTEIKM